jgi:hypothetical protein
MGIALTFVERFVSQLQSPTLAFLIGGVLIMALGSKLTIPNSIYKFVVFLLMMKIGLEAGTEIRHANLVEMILPALMAVGIGILIVFLGNLFFSLLPKIGQGDGAATAGLFGAVSASTLAAALVLLEEQSIAFEAWVPALYPFMDIPALIMAIVLANIQKRKASGGPKRKFTSGE